MIDSRHFRGDEAQQSLNLESLRLFPPSALQGQLPAAYADGFSLDASVDDLYTALGRPARFEVEYGWPYAAADGRENANLHVEPGALAPTPALPTYAPRPSDEIAQSCATTAPNTSAPAPLAQQEIPQPLFAGLGSGTTGGGATGAQFGQNPMDGLAPPTFLGDMSLGFSNFGVSDAPTSAAVGD